jgi:hypothetical protein
MAFDALSSSLAAAHVVDDERNRSRKEELAFICSYLSSQEMNARLGQLHCLHKNTLYRKVKPEWRRSRQYNSEVFVSRSVCHLNWYLQFNSCYVYNMYSDDSLHLFLKAKVGATFQNYSEKRRSVSAWQSVSLLGERAIGLGKIRMTSEINLTRRRSVYRVWNMNASKTNSAHFPILFSPQQDNEERKPFSWKLSLLLARVRHPLSPETLE